jgi:hypothetical protein
LQSESAAIAMSQFKTLTPASDQLGTQITSLLFEFSFSPNTSGVTTLENSGELSVLDLDLQRQITEYYSLTEKIRERDIISNHFIQQKMEPLLIGQYGWLWNSQNPAQYIQEAYANDPRPLPQISAQTILDNKALEVMIFARIYQTKVQLTVYDQAIVALNQLISIIDKQD